MKEGVSKVSEPYNDSDDSHGESGSGSSYTSDSGSEYGDEISGQSSSGHEE